MACARGGMRNVAASVADNDPQDAVAREMCCMLGRSMQLPERLADWTAPLFPDEDPVARRLRAVACWLSDVGAHDHPEYRAEQTYLRILRLQGWALRIRRGPSCRLRLRCVTGLTCRWRICNPRASCSTPRSLPMP